MARAVPLVAACSDRSLIPLMPHPGQWEFLKLIDGNRITIGACGRRWGKSRAVAAAALHNLLLTPAADALVAPGETRYALVVSNSREQSLILKEHARTLVLASPALRAELVADEEHELRFRGNRALLAIPCNARSVRGYAASFIAFDEMAHFIDESQGGPRVAQRLWASLTPSIAQFGAFGKIVAISTPSSDAGLFAELYQRCRGGEIPGAAAYSAPTSENPMIDQEYLEAQEIALGPDDYDREFRALFTSGSAAFIEPERVRECVQSWREVLPRDGKDWVVSIDPSFSRDPAALAVVGRSPSDGSRLVVGYTQRWLPSKKRWRRSREEDTARIEAVVGEMAAICIRYGCSVLISDQHLSGVVASEFSKHGLRVRIRSWTTDSKLSAFRSLRALIYSGRIELPDDPVLIAEASRLRESRGASPKVETPRSGDSHCDLVVAVAAACLEHEKHSRAPARTFSSFKVRPTFVDRRSPESVEPPRRRGSAFALQGRFSEARLQREHGGAFSPGVTRGPQA